MVTEANQWDDDGRPTLENMQARIRSMDAHTRQIILYVVTESACGNRRPDTLPPNVQALAIQCLWILLFQAEKETGNEKTC